MKRFVSVLVVAVLLLGGSAVADGDRSTENDGERLMVGVMEMTLPKGLRPIMLPEVDVSRELFYSAFGDAETVEESNLLLFVSYAYATLREEMTGVDDAQKLKSHRTFVDLTLVNYGLADIADDLATDIITLPNGVDTMEIRAAYGHIFGYTGYYGDSQACFILYQKNKPLTKGQEAMIWSSMDSIAVG